MAITLNAFSGSETVSTTEWSLTTDTAGPDVDTTTGIFQPFLDLNAVAAGDIFEFKVYDKISGTGDTQRVIYSAQFSGSQSTPIWVGPTLILGHGWDMTLDKLSGTDRLILWRISKVA